MGSMGRMDRNSSEKKTNRKGIRTLIAFICLVPLFAVFYMTSIADQTDPDIVLEEWDSAVSGAAVEPTGDPEGIDPLIDPENPEDVSLPLDGSDPVAGDETGDPTDGILPEGTADPDATDPDAAPTPDITATADPESTEAPKESGDTSGKGTGAKRSGPAVRALGARQEDDIEIVEAGDVVLPDDPWKEYATVGGGMVLAEPTFQGVKDTTKEELSGNIDYTLNASTTGAYSTMAGRRMDFDLPLGKYGVVLEPGNEPATCKLGDNNHLDTGKTLEVTTYPHSAAENNFDDLVETTRTPGNPDPVDGEIWYRSVTISPKSGYHFLKESGQTFAIDDTPRTYSHNETLGDTYLAKEDAAGTGATLVLAVFAGMTQKYNIDNLVPTGDIKGYDGYSGSGPYTITDKTVTSLTMTYEVSDAARTTDSGKSGVVSIEYKMTNKGQGGPITEEQYNNVTQKVGMDSEKTEVTGDGSKLVTARLDGFTDGDSIYIYSKVTDAAGNSVYFARYFGRMDFSGPAFSSPEGKIDARVKELPDGGSMALDLLMFKDDTYRIHIEDRNLQKVVFNGEEQTLLTDGEFKYVNVNVSRPDTVSTQQKYSITAIDESGHEKSLLLRCLNCALTPDAVEINLGSIPYGYVLPSRPEEYTAQSDPIEMTDDKGEFIVGKTGDIFRLECAHTLDVGKAISSVTLTGADFTYETKPVSSSGETDYRYWLKPVEKLDCGSYSALLTVDYDLQKATDDPNTILLGDGLASGTVEKSVRFTVTKVPITLQYRNGRSSHSTDDGSNEFYGKRPGATTPNGEADWSERFSVASGLKYDQTDEAVYKDKYYQKPRVINVLPVGEGVLQDGFVLGDGELYFEIGEGDASTNYRYAYSGAGYESTVHGVVHCVHDSFGRSEGADKRSYSRIATAGRPNWYTSEVIIKNEEGFKIMNAGTVPCQYDFATGKVSVSSVTTGYVKKFSEKELTSDPIVVSKDSTNGTGVVQYFYQYEEKTRVASDLMSEVILIDRSRPGYTWDTSVGETALEGLPYFRFLERAGDVVLAAVGDLPATKSDPISLHNLEDPESGVLSAQYLILDESGLSKAALDKQSGWRDLLKSGSNYYLSGGIPETGYLYVKISNYAGLSTYLSMNDRVDFSGESKSDKIRFEDVKVPNQIYGYKDPEPYLIPYSGESKDGGPIYIKEARVDEGPGGGSQYFSVRNIGETGRWYITPKEGLEAGTYKGFLLAQFSNSEVRTVKITFEVEKKPLTASYVLSKVSYYAGEYIIDDGRLEVTGFVPGEGRSTSADGTIVKAEDYVDPEVEVPSVAQTSMWVGPKGGQAKNYSFNYTGSFLTVNKRTPQEGLHYSVTSNFPTKGWATADIVISGGAADGSDRGRYRIALKPDCSDAVEKITLSEETNKGKITFYILDTMTGEIMGPVVYDYKIDKHPPVITGATEGTTYTENARQIVVTDTNLKTVTLNGQTQPVSAGRSTFTVHPTSPTQRFDVYAVDEAGQTATLSFVMIQPAELVPTAAPAPGGTDIDPVPTPQGDDVPGGSVVSTVQAQNGAPIVRISSGDDEIKNAVLNDTELAAVEDGSNLSLRVVVRDISGEVSQSDKERAFQVLNGYTIGEYLSITVWKRVGSGEETQVFRTNSPISLTISVPPGLQSDKTDRRFAMLRLAPEATDMLKDKDKVPKKVTIYTDEFDAVYVLAYMDMPKSAKKDDSDDKNDASDGSPSKKNKTSVELGPADQPEAGDHAPVIPTAIAFGVSLLGMIIVVVIRRNSRYEWVWVDEEEEDER